MLTLCPGHSDFIIQATSSRKTSLQSVRSSSFVFVTGARVDMAYFTTHNNGPPINAEGEKTPAKNMVMFF